MNSFVTRILCQILPPKSHYYFVNKKENKGNYSNRKGDRGQFQKSMAWYVSQTPVIGIVKLRYL